MLENRQEDSLWKGQMAGPVPTDGLYGQKYSSPKECGNNSHSPPGVKAQPPVQGMLLVEMMAVKLGMLMKKWGCKGPHEEKAWTPFCSQETRTVKRGLNKRVSEMNWRRSWRHPQDQSVSQQPQLVPVVLKMLGCFSVRLRGRELTVSRERFPPPRDALKKARGVGEWFKAWRDSRSMKGPICCSVGVSQK